VGYSKLVYFDGDAGRSVLTDVASGGGINAAPDGSLIYIAETGGQRLRVLSRNADGSLTDVIKVPLGTSPDNIDVTADGSLTIAAHANLVALIQHFISGAPAPAQVLLVSGSPKAGYTVDEIYLNTGEEISASSVGATYNNKLLIGSIDALQVLICEAD
jgi:arylesterase / paraoxonase